MPIYACTHYPDVHLRREMAEVVVGGSGRRRWLDLSQMDEVRLVRKREDKKDKKESMRSRLVLGG